VLLALHFVDLTGRRIGAVRNLRREDITFGTPPSIRWRQEFDKCGNEGEVPIGHHLAEIVTKHLDEVPCGKNGCLIPARNARTGELREHPMTTDALRYWLGIAERRAGVKRGQHCGWHAYRRKFATQRKHLPVADVMAVMGLSDVNVFHTSYARPDMETLLRVVKLDGTGQEGG